MLEIKRDVELSRYTTFQVGGEADFFAVIKNEGELPEALAFAKTRKLPIFILGGGSNLLVSDSGVKALVLRNEIKGFKFTNHNKETVVLEAGAGEVWDEIVALSVNQGLSGLENLSGIPGTVGGAAVQNAGAYGVEIKDCLISVEGLNLSNGKTFVFNNKNCEYGYRSSFFKKNKKLFITRVAFALNKQNKFNLEYKGLKTELEKENEITLNKVRQAVLNIRAEKLPDWHKVGTAGSFFKNPVVSFDEYNKLKENYHEIPGFPEKNNKIKIPLAWILDRVCELKNYKEGRAGLYEKQPLVLINFGGASEKEIIKLSEKVKEKVFAKTGIRIDEEVEFIK